MDIKNTPLHEFFNIYWNHIKKHLQTNPVAGSEEEIEILVSDMEAIKRKYSNNAAMQKFVTSLLIAYLTYLEETNGRITTN